MAIEVTPALKIGGYDIACTADRVDKEVVAVRGIQIDWGRSDYHDSQTTPATMTIHLLDSSEQWATYIRQGKAIGREVILTWTGKRINVGSTASIIKKVLFRGRVARAQAKITMTEAEHGARRWLITLTCSDSAATLGGVIPGPVTLPAESMLDRARRLKGFALVGGTKIDDVTFNSSYNMQGTSPLDVQGKNALQIMGEFYASMAAETWAYDPHGNVVRQVSRLSHPIDVHLESADQQYGAVMPVAGNVADQQVTYPGVGFGGCHLRGEPMIEADPATQINRVEANWDNREYDWDSTVTVSEIIYPGDARRVLTWDTWLGDQNNIDRAQEKVWARVSEEGRRPAHPEFTTPPTHTFPTYDVAQWVLMTWENPRPAFISGDAAHQWLMGGEDDYPPIVAPIGGKLTFHPQDGWSAIFRTQFIHNTRTAGRPVPWIRLRQERPNSSQRTIPWRWEIYGKPTGRSITDPSTIKEGQVMPDRNLEWGPAGPDTGHRFHTSVTWADMKHITIDSANIKDNIRS